MDLEALHRLEAQGIIVKGAEKVRAGSDANEIEVEAENWDAVRVFNAMDTQWQFTALSTPRSAALLRTGLNYAALPVVAGGLKVAVDEKLLACLRALERETVEIFGERTRQSLRRS